MKAHHLATLALLLTTTIGLTACGGGGSSEPDSVTPPTEPPTAPPTTPEPPTTPAPTEDHSGLTPLSAETPIKDEYLAGGDTTLFVTNEDAFSTRPEAIADDFRLDGFFTSGDHLFRTPHEDIGPILNTSNCQGCHLNDGRGVVPASATAPMLSMLVKVGRSDGSADPIYGDQIQPFAEQSFTTSDFDSGLPVHNGSVNGTELYGEAFPFIEYEMVDGSYPDGTSYQLRKPILKIRDLSFGAFSDDIRFSPRVAPQAFGVGLLAEIPADNILKLADPNDADNDGISGRASMVTNAISGETELGRFAYKAQNPTVLQQVAGAYNGDIGITTTIFTNEPCTDAQLACQQVAAQESKVGDDVDFSNRELALVEFYNRVLGVPARRGFDRDSETWGDEVTQGRKHFFDSGCTSCHTPRHITQEAPGSVLGQLTLTSLEPNPAPIEILSNQVIFPYTDLLLHDMGGSCQVTRELIDGQSCNSNAQECLYVQRCEGLADGLIQGDASGSEWKTPALWGLGLVQTVNADSTFLHDGRARTIEEAILWHGGEAETAKNNFMQLSQAERAQLLSFLESL
ncbi:di-heme oxidoredictase family protein [Thalassotalea euphylliae]|uniref:Thiol oxidoreductase n=1 Tax=Thalassotalea euphylliae TaxID=1655234 RepID=A0A3E0UIA4_9GAMM|nr:di-heme oxidoredictase family protein [Thalassotalea euphylliae]REL36324.1 thiol oxidoreductase [Thalassotalea euphylliae]